VLLLMNSIPSVTKSATINGKGKSVQVA